MIAKDKATEMVSKNFSIIAEYVGFKGVNGAKDEHEFKSIENVAKTVSIEGINSLVNSLKKTFEPILNKHQTEAQILYYEEVKKEIENL